MYKLVVNHYPGGKTIAEKTIIDKKIKTPQGVANKERKFIDSYVRQGYLVELNKGKTFIKYFGLDVFTKEPNY